MKSDKKKLYSALEVLYEIFLPNQKISCNTVHKTIWLLGLSTTWLEYNIFPLRLYLQPFIECTEYSLEKVEGWKAILESGLGLLNYTPTPKLTQSNLIKPCCVLHRNPLLPSEWHRGIKISPTFRPYLRPLSTRIVSQSRVRLCTLVHL